MKPALRFTITFEDGSGFDAWVHNQPESDEAMRRLLVDVDAYSEAVEWPEASTPC